MYICTESFFTMTSVMSSCIDLNLEFSRVNNSHLFSVRNILDCIAVSYPEYCGNWIRGRGEKVKTFTPVVPTKKTKISFSYHAPPPFSHGASLVSETCSAAPASRTCYAQTPKCFETVSFGTRDFL